MKECVCKRQDEVQVKGYPGQKMTPITVVMEAEGKPSRKESIDL